MRFVVKPTTLDNFISLLKVLDTLDFQWFALARPLDKLDYFVEHNIGMGTVVRRDAYLVLYTKFKELRYTTDISSEKSVILDITMKDYLEHNCIILNGGTVWKYM